MGHDYRAGDPVWISLPGYEGTGVVVMALDGEGLLVQVRGTAPAGEHRSEVVREELIPYAARHYNRPTCRYCHSLRMVVDGMPRGCLRWTCCDCLGGQDT